MSFLESTNCSNSKMGMHSKNFHTPISRVITPNAIPPSDSKCLDANLNYTANHLAICAVNFGVQFTVALGKAKLDSTVETNMKDRYRNFLLEAAK